MVIDLKKSLTFSREACSPWHQIPFLILNIDPCIQIFWKVCSLFKGESYIIRVTWVIRYAVNINIIWTNYSMNYFCSGTVTVGMWATTKFRAICVSVEIVRGADSIHKHPICQRSLLTHASINIALGTKVSLYHVGVCKRYSDRICFLGFWLAAKIYKCCWFLKLCWDEQW